MATKKRGNRKAGPRAARKGATKARAQRGGGIKRGTPAQIRAQNAAYNRAGGGRAGTRAVNALRDRYGLPRIRTRGGVATTGGG